MDAVHSKYGYTQVEMLFMLIITGITNFSCVPALIMFYRKKMHFQTFFGFLTMLSSFMYHSMDSVNLATAFLSEGQWHRIDNIGSITCMLMLMTHLMDNDNPDLDSQLNYFGLFITLICQEKSPWEIEYTIIPIFVFMAMWIGSFFVRCRLPRYNYKMFGATLLFFGFGCIGFYNGLDEFTDYLRMWHGSWHMFVGIGSFFAWQSKTMPEEVVTFRNFLTKPIKDKRRYAEI